MSCAFCNPLRDQSTRLTYVFQPIHGLSVGPVKATGNGAYDVAPLFHPTFGWKLGRANVVSALGNVLTASTATRARIRAIFIHHFIIGLLSMTAIVS